MERTTLYADGEFNLTDNTQVYAEVLLNRRKTRVDGYRQFWGYTYNDTFFGGNPLNSEWTGAQWFSPTVITNEGSDESNKIDYQRFVAGITGEFSQSWFWDLSFQHSESDGEYTSEQIFDDSVWANNFLHGSCEGTVTAVRGVPCQDVPWMTPDFANGIYTDSIREFLFGTETGNTKYTQWSVEGFVSGDLFELPAGSMAGAFGFHYREDEINDTPGEITLAGNGWGTSAAGITAGSDETKAVFAELDIPLITGKPGFEALTLNASGRWTDVQSYGDDTTYKVGLNWQIVPSLRLRANQGTSFRTPALFELFLADQTSFLGQRFFDPCIRWGAALAAGDISQRVADNCAATVDAPLNGDPIFPDGLPPDFRGGTVTATLITGGGFGVLEAERSKSRNIGLIWTPEFANLNVSVDYFDIEVKDQVDQLGPGAVVGGCYNSEFFPTDPLCDLFDRTGLLGGIDNIRDSFINVARQTNTGWDLALKWTADIWGGAFTLDTQHTIQTEAITALFEDTARDENGEFGDPKWVGRLWLTYDRSDWSYFWGMQFVGKVSNHESFGGDTTTITDQLETVQVVLSADEYVYHTFSVTKNLPNAGLTAVLGIRNAFDKKPPRVSNLGLGELGNFFGYRSLYSQYDFYGRTFYGNINWDF